jgi:hypothetical protein
MDYVLLTGGKNNAGDFLIKHRAIQLLSRHRPDRGLLDLNGWEPFSGESLERVNRAKALILAGGPALQKDMRERVYPMVDNLDRIKVPIVMMGVGWKSASGNWQDTHGYPLSGGTRLLLRRIAADGLLNSVRDYHTLNTLFDHGLEQVLMTGCPALYALDETGGDLACEAAGGFELSERSRVSFSAGVGFARSPSMLAVMQQLIEAVHRVYPRLTVVFHHSLDRAAFTKAYRNSNPVLVNKQNELLHWLEGRGIGCEDISGGVERMIQHYSASDLHIGYRVHAHIYMTSVGKPSVLINEDGRGKALKDVIGGLIFDGYEKRNSPYRMIKAMFRGIKRAQDVYTAAGNLPEDVLRNLAYETANGAVRLRVPMTMVGRHYAGMQNFLKCLP